MGTRRRLHSALVVKFSDGLFVFRSERDDAAAAAGETLSCLTVVSVAGTSWKYHQHGGALSLEKNKKRGGRSLQGKAAKALDSLPVATYPLSSTVEKGIKPAVTPPTPVVVHLRTPPRYRPRLWEAAVFGAAVVCTLPLGLLYLRSPCPPLPPPPTLLKRFL